ncbi:MAG: SapC family protein [Acidovorax sp.]|jgi:hypothetical protein|nr:SapC family protein [Acidovorax sp.]
MLNPTLYNSPALLDAQRHQSLRLKQGFKAVCCAQGVNVVFIAANEFEHVCKEYPIVFVPAGEDKLGRKQMAPVAVMGLEQGENLYFRTSKSGRVGWQARYIPSFLRYYPFTLGQVDASRWAVCIDEDSEAWSKTTGQPLFDEQGQPSALVREMHAALQNLEREIEQTRVIGERLRYFDLLQPRVLTTTLPDGSSFAADGFYTLDEKRLAELSKMQLAELHRNGSLHALSLHKASLSNLDALAQRRWKRMKT